MAMESVTKGPWEKDDLVFQDADGIPALMIWGPEGQGAGRVAQVYGETGFPVNENIEANADLIAEAPNLLRACEWAWELLLQIRTDGDFENWDFVVNDLLIPAIRRAKGEVS
jgi:hypothetical protein